MFETGISNDEILGKLENSTVTEKYQDSYQRSFNRITTISDDAIAGVISSIPLSVSVCSSYSVEHENITTWKDREEFSKTILNRLIVNCEIRYLKTIAEFSDAVEFYLLINSPAIDIIYNIVNRFVVMLSKKRVSNKIKIDLSVDREMLNWQEIVISLYVEKVHFKNKFQLWNEIEQLTEQVTSQLKKGKNKQEITLIEEIDSKLAVEVKSM